MSPPSVARGAVGVQATPLVLAASNREPQLAMAELLGFALWFAAWALENMARRALIDFAQQRERQRTFIAHGMNKLNCAVVRLSPAVLSDSLACPCAAAMGTQSQNVLIVPD